MKIYFERSGGFAGRSVSTVVDTNQIPPEQALSILEKVDSSDFFCLPHELSGGMESMSGADHLSYKVTVEVAGVQHTVETSDESAPQALQPLLDELTYLARNTAVPSIPLESRSSRSGHNR